MRSNLIRGEREIHPEEAAIVRRIFGEYVEGQPPRAIAASLNRDGIPSPRGGLWNASTINGSRQRKNGILNNELYLGRITYNRQRFVKDPDSGKRQSRVNPEHLDPTPTIEIHPNLGELYRRNVKELGGLLTDEASRPQAMEIIRGLIERIEVAPGDMRGKANVTLYGALASILDFAVGATNAKATADGGSCRVFLVAGAGCIEAPTLQVAA